MLTPVAQRWRDRRGTYRLIGEPFDPRTCEVAEIPDDRTAKGFVVRHHYARSYPAARFRFGLYERAELAGVAVFSVPVRPEVLRPFPVDAAVELGRLVLLDRVRANAESWFIARCLGWLRREGLEGVVSFSDPEPRTDAEGRCIFMGHIGGVYQSTNSIYTGRAKADTIYLLPDGTVFPRRALVKIRKHETGWHYAVERLVEAGAAPLTGDLDAWLQIALLAVTRKVRHGGNHRYLFPLTRAARRLAPEGRPYPKFDPWLSPACLGVRQPILRWDGAP